MEPTKNIVHKISEELLQWIICEANEARWVKENLAFAVCKIISKHQNFPKISEEMLQWIIHQANEDNLVKKELSIAVCNKSSDKRPTLLLFDEEAQKQLAVLDKAKTCQIVPWLGRELQRWMLEGNWDQEMVSRYLAREVKEGELVVSARMSYPLGQLSKKA